MLVRVLSSKLKDFEGQQKKKKKDGGLSRGVVTCLSVCASACFAVCLFHSFPFFLHLSAFAVCIVAFIAILYLCQ